LFADEFGGGTGWCCDYILFIEISRPMLCVDISSGRGNNKRGCRQRRQTGGSGINHQYASSSGKQAADGRFLLLLLDTPPILDRSCAES